jgi:hypothetical protein
MFGIFKSNEPEEIDDGLFFNPDPIVNRLDAVMRYTREYEISSDIKCRKAIMQAINIIFVSLEMERTLDETTH